MKPPSWVCSTDAALVAIARVMAVLAVAVLLAARPAAAVEGGVTRLTAALFVLDASETPPPDSAPWQSVSLPDRWNDTRPGVLGFAWYRLGFDLDARPARSSIFIPRVRSAAAVYVNGVEVGRVASWDAAENPSRIPYLFEIPESALRQGPNRIDIRLLALQNYDNGLGSVSVGEHRKVRTQFERRRDLQITGPQVSFVLTALFGMFSLLLWLRRREPIHLWFGLSMACFAMYTTGAFVLHPPLPARWWLALGDVAAFGKMFFLALFALRFAAVRWPRVERSLWVVMAATVGAIGMTAAGSTNELFGLVGDIAWRLFSIVATAALFAAAWTKRDVEHTLIALSSVVHPIVTTYFVGLTPWFYGYPSQPDFETLFPGAYDFLPMLLVVAWALVGRFVNSLDQAESLNAHLEQRVSEKHAELESNYRRLHLLEQQQAVLAERARMMSDMHDGIGGQLISTLSLVEHGKTSLDEVAAALRDCIDDLRLAIDSLEPAEDDLLPLLGNLRYRLEPRLKAGGIALDWQVEDVPKLACLTPQNVLHILRILQEALTNVLKHAHATTIRIATRFEGGRVLIDVIDDGQGMGDMPAGQGHGLANMRRRTRAMGAELLLRPSANGTTITLGLPVAAAQAA